MAASPTLALLAVLAWAPDAPAPGLPGPAVPAPPPVQVPAPQPKRDPWPRLLERVRREGAFTPRADGEGARFTLASGPDRPRARGLIRRVILRGFNDDSGAFQPILVLLEREDWSLDPAGRWLEDRWSFRLAVDRKLLGVTRVRRTLAPDGTVLAGGFEEVPGDDPRAAHLLPQLVHFGAGEPPAAPAGPDSTAAD